MWDNGDEKGIIKSVWRHIKWDAGKHGAVSGTPFITTTCLWVKVRKIRLLLEGKRFNVNANDLHGGIIPVELTSIFVLIMGPHMWSPARGQQNTKCMVLMHFALRSPSY